MTALAELVDVVLGDVEVTQERLAGAEAQLSALHSGLVALREQLGGEGR